MLHESRASACWWCAKAKSLSPSTSGSLQRGVATRWSRCASKGPLACRETLVDRALELKREAEAQAHSERDENLAYDEVWCVFDVDAHPKVAEARDLAQRNGLHLAMSNPCFELWLYLHLHENPGAQSRHELQKRCRQDMPGEKAKYIAFEKLIIGYDDAYRRAQRLARDAESAVEFTRNPTTEVFRLTDSIDENGQQRRSRPLRDEGRVKAQAAAAAAQAQFELELIATPKPDVDS